MKQPHDSAFDPRRGWAIALALAMGQIVIGAPPPETQIRQWVDLLGSPKFVIRENATQQLLSAGSAALPLLRESSQNHDREVRKRAHWIKTMIQRRRRADRLAAFTAGQTLDPEFDELPGWSAFSRRYGDDSRSRGLFAQMIESEWGLFVAAYNQEEATLPLRTLLIQRLHQLHLAGYRSFPLSTMLTTYVLGADFPDELGVHLHYQFCLQHAGLRAALDPSNGQPLVRKIVGSWVIAASGRSANTYDCLRTAERFRLEEGAVAAVQTLQAKPAPPNETLDRAMQVLAKLGDKSQAHMLEPLLDNAEVLRPTTSKRQRQIRDVALACLFQMHGGDLSKIGVRRSASSTQLFDANSLGYSSEAERQQAMQEWLALKSKVSRR